MRACSQIPECSLSYGKDKEKNNTINYQTTPIPFCLIKLTIIAVHIIINYMF